MIGRIKPRRVLALARQDVPTPVDVVNLITPSRFDRYRWYGLLVMPALVVVGGRPLWMGKHERVICGERQAEKFLIVRYPSHRRFMAMVLNPYYVAINRLREAGVARFEASFTHATHVAPDLARRKLLVGVHFHGELDDVVAAMDGCELVYATRATASLGFLDPPAPTDPNPMTFSGVALFAPPGDALPEVALEGCAVHVYRREARSEYRPW
ncbi:MAG TPA: DUF1330 domain-containing protein [Solirubrobacteraceae bacterium]